MKPTVKFKKLNDNAHIPTYGSPYSAGADLYSAEVETVIQPHTTAFIGTGIALEIPKGYMGLIFARSGLSCKRHLAPANKVGVIDSDYRGEVKVALHNHSNEPQKIDAGERIAQLVITPFLAVDFEQADELDETQRGEGGFGSTGKK